MDYRVAFAISATGMALERLRLDVTALNLANMHATRGPDGKLFSPLKVVTNSVRSTFSEQFGHLFSAQGLPGIAADVVETGVQPRLAHEPGHPAADENGFVAYPGVNQLDQMITMMTALRSYEANVAAMNAAKSMAQKALEIGGSQ